MDPRRVRHDLDLAHSLIPGDPIRVHASARAVRGAHADEATAHLYFPEGREVRLFASRIADARRRTMRLTYPDGVIEIDFLTRAVRNTTRRPNPSPVSWSMMSENTQRSLSSK